MKSPLSAGPTPDDLDDEQTTDETNSNDGQSTEQQDDTPTTQSPDHITWHCPYCDYTHTELPDLRDHITTTIEGKHKGIGGWSPTQDIIGTNDDGDIVRRIDGTGKRPDEDHHLDPGEKKKLIINAWFELEKKRDIDAITAIIPVTEEYTRRIIKQLEDGDITPDEYREELDWSVRDDLGDRLEKYHSQHDDTKQMSLTASADELERGAKKKQIINAWLVDNDISPTTLDGILDSSYEYIRRELKAIKDGDIDDEEIEAAADDGLQREIRARLASQTDDTTDEDTPDSAGASDADTDTAPYQDTLENASKKSRVINSVLLARELGADFTNKTMAGAANCSTQYAQRITKNIKDGDITEQELNDAADNELQDALHQYYIDQDAITPNDYRESEDNQPNTVPIDLSNKHDPFERVDASKREILVNIFLYNPEISKADAGTLAGASNEYARQTYNGIQNGEYDPSEYENNAILTALSDLDDSGALDAFFTDDDGPTNTAPSTATDTTDPTSTTNSTDTPTTSADREMIPASEIKDLREVADMLYRQANYEGGGSEERKAEFIAKEMRDRLDELIKTA